MRWIKQQKFICHSSGGQEVQGQGAGRVVSGEGSLPCLQVATLSLCPHITGRELWCLSLFFFFFFFLNILFIYLIVPSLRRRRWHPTPVLLPRKSHGWRSLVGCSPWGLEESDTTERLHFHFPLSCNGEGNGNPLQCSFLENPRDGGAWWAAVYGVTQSRTRLKRLSSSSSAKS